jgi:hypothetical protein
MCFPLGVAQKEERRCKTYEMGIGLKEHHLHNLNILCLPTNGLEVKTSNQCRQDRFILSNGKSFSS